MYHISTFFFGGGGGWRQNADTAGFGEEFEAESINQN